MYSTVLTMQIMIPVNEAPPIIAAVAILCTFDVIVVALRFYVRRKLRIPLKCDDWLALSALVCFYIDKSVTKY